MARPCVVGRSIFHLCVMSNFSQAGRAVAHATPTHIRQADLVGIPEVTPEQAEANRRAGKSPVRARPGRPGMVPFSAATLWRMVGDGRFPKPVKLSERVTAWPLAEVQAWLDSRRV